MLLEAPAGLLSSLRERFGELLELVRKGLVLAPLKTDPGAGRGFPNGFVEPLRGEMGQKTDKLDINIILHYYREHMKFTVFSNSNYMR